ncbi:putative quinol monooxygenase [Novosphingobium sp. 9]|uniref:putative quinol monooxygenase n=1 Tax=Novosphingobium sp. 9 TaxID=2025349 RepID=UPI0021B68D9A|nr:hypothetical protein [Novosphingobium sp. 9]
MRLPLVLVTALFSAPALAASPATVDAPVRAIVNVDLMPSDEVPGTALLKAYVAQSRHDADVVSIALVSQDGSANHFILDETFASRSAYARFVASSAVRSFRQALFPHLGSPWDERSGTEVSE